MLFTFIAMFLYAGGTEFDATATHYDLIRNFFSDLGRTVVFDGRSNYGSSILFTLAACICGILLVPYFLLLSTIPFENIIKKRFAQIATGFAMIAAPAYAAIGLIPCNLNMEMHLIAVVIAFLGSWPVSLIYGFLLINYKSYPKAAGRLFLLFAFLLMGYIGIMAAYPDPTQTESLIIQVIGQKIIIYAEMGMMWLQGIIAYRWISHTHKIDSNQINTSTATSFLLIKPKEKGEL